MGHHHALTRGASFWVSAAVVTHTLWTSAAPTMTYPLYAAEWHLTPTITTGIFAIYPVVVVAMLILFGDLSDHIGRRATMLLGLAASIVGVFLFAVAPDITWVFIGRAFMGVGVGLSASPSTAAMVEFGGSEGSAKASYVTAAGQALGLALAVLVAGALIQYAPFPTRLNFLVLLAMLIVLFAVAWFLPRHTAGETKGRWKPRIPYVAPGIRAVFVASTLGVTAAYALGALMLGLGAQIARDLIGSSNVLVNGAALALLAAVMGGMAVGGRNLGATQSIVVGAVGSIVGLGLMAVAAREHGLAVFIAAVFCLGIGYSLLFSGGLKLINANAPAHHRGATLSALFLIAYLLQGAIALLLGAVATRWGLEASVDLGVPGLMAINILALAAAVFVSRRRSSVVPARA